MADIQESIKSYSKEHESMIGFSIFKVFCGTKLTDAAQSFADKSKTRKQTVEEVFDCSIVYPSVLVSLFV